MRIQRVFKGAGTFLGSMAATAIAVQGVAAFFGGVTISLFDAAPEGKLDNTFLPTTEDNGFTAPAVAVSETPQASATSATVTSKIAPKLAKKLNTNVSVLTVAPIAKQSVAPVTQQTFAPILLPTDGTVSTNATSGGSGGSSSANGGSYAGSGNGGSNATSGGSGGGKGGSNSGGGKGGSNSGGGESHDDDNDHGGSSSHGNDDDD